MRETKLKLAEGTPGSPPVMIFHLRSPEPLEPSALERNPAVNNQIRHDEDTIIWGIDDTMPLRIAKTVEDSPAATSCLDTRARFIKGARFSNERLMKLRVNNDGETLWQLHCRLVQTIVLYDGFSVNFKFNEAMKVVSSYCMDFESVRFMRPDYEQSGHISKVKYNPYFGTGEYKKEFSKEYHLWDPEALSGQMNAPGERFRGQVYYYGRTKPTHRFYPSPDYLSAQKWMYVDHKIQEAHAENVDNGFFQSVEMVQIGDPNRASDNPKYQKEITDESGNKVKRATKTVGQEFNEQMSETFSGVSKMGTVMVRWFKNASEADASQIRPFPSNANGELFLALQDLTTKNITIATKVPGILANISEGVSLGSDGNEMQKAVELMQSITVEDRELLESFYNEVLLPNMEPSLIGDLINERVEIVNYNPITVPVEIDDKFWEVLTDRERREFIRQNLPYITLLEEEAQATLQGTQPQEQQTNEALRNLTGRQMQQIQRTVNKFNKGELTFEQAKAMLQSGFGLTDEQINVFLIQEEDGQTTDTLRVSQ